MIDAAAKALAQMFSPPLRWVLLKSAGLALAMIVLLAIALHRLLVWAASAGANWAQDMFGISAPAPISILIWVVSVAAGVGIIDNATSFGAAGQFGLGTKVFFGKSWALRLDVRDQLYKQQILSVRQYVQDFSLTLGVSVFLPTRL